MARSTARLDTLMRGPCWFCRRPMNWFAATTWFDPICRYCLMYILHVGPVPYLTLLVCRANEAGMRRGERVRVGISTDERRN